jgi:hypothetical protein
MRRGRESTRHCGRLVLALLGLAGRAATKAKVQGENGDHQRKRNAHAPVQAGRIDAVVTAVAE